MNWLLQSPAAETLGGVLLHFVWQETLIGIALQLALWTLRGSRAANRYLACCVAMLAMAVVPSFLLIATLIPSVPPIAAPPVAWPPRLLPYPSAVEPLVHGRLGAALPWIVAIWLAGVLVLSARALGCWLAAQRLAHSKVSAAPAAIRASAQRIANSMRVRRAIVVVQSALAEVPAVVGWIKPMILIPTGLLTGLTGTQLEHLIAHEVAHIRRHDYLVNLLQTAIETLLFYHPAVWWTSRQIRLERENCCDDLAVSACGDAIGYARALAELERIRSVEPQLAMRASGGQLLSRIRRLVLPSCTNPGRPAPVFALLLAVPVLAGIFVAHSASAQAAEDSGADALFAHLHARDWVVEGEVKRLLGEVQAIGNIQPFLIALQSRREWQSREKAAWVLGMVGNSNTVEGLSTSLGDESPSVRHTAAWALGRIGDARAIDALAANLNDTSAEARSGAVWALGSIGEPRAVDTVIRALADPDSDVRTAAAWALGTIGDPRGEAALRRAVDDQNAEVRNKAAEALLRLRR